MKLFFLLISALTDNPALPGAGFTPWPELGLRDVVWTGEEFVASGQDYGHGSLAVSRDGRRWKMVDVRFDVGRLMFSGDHFFAMNVNDRELMVSVDQMTWQRTSYSFENRFGHPIGIAHDGERWVLMTNNGEIWTSEDGLAWERRLESNFGPFNPDFGEIVWTGSRFLAGRGSILSSDDGSNWTDHELNGYDLNVDGPMIVACGKGVIHVSQEGTSWTTHDLETNEGVVGAVWSGVGYLAFGQSGSVFTSADGENWQSAPAIPAAPISASGTSGDEALVIGGGILFSSSDGQIWREIGGPLTWSEDAFWASDGETTLLGRYAFGVRRYSQGRLDPVYTRNEGQGSGLLFPTADRLFASLERTVHSPDHFAWHHNNLSMDNLVEYEGDVLGQTDYRTYRFEDQDWVEVPEFEFQGRLVTVDDRLFSAGWPSRIWDEGAWVSLDIKFIDLVDSEEGFVALSESQNPDRSIFRSSDGFQWDTIGHVPAEITRMAHHDGRLYVCGSDGRLGTSVDGASWVLLDSGVTADLVRFTEIGESLYVFGHSATLLEIDGESVRRASFHRQRDILDMVEWQGRLVLSLDGKDLYYPEYEIISGEEIVDPDHVIPWVVSNQTWYSRIALLNTERAAVRVRLDATTREGETLTEWVTVPAGGVTVAEAASLFPNLTGYALRIGSGSDKVFPSFLTINDDPATGGQSPSQTTASPLSGLSNELLFGYVPGDEVSAVVLVNPIPGAGEVPVTLALLDQTGDELTETTVTLEGNRPLATLVRDLFPDVSIPPDAAVTAKAAPDVLIAGTTFVFNARGQPSMARSFSR